MPKKYDKNEPILVLIRRGRKGRGFSVSPVEDISNPAVCQTSTELGEIIEEMLDDEEQPRVDLKELMAAATSDARDDHDRDGDDDRNDHDDHDDHDNDDEEDDEEGDGEGDGGIMDGVVGSEDPADRLLLNIFSSLVNKGRSMSSKPRKPRSRTRTRKRRPKKPKKDK